MKRIKKHLHQTPAITKVHQLVNAIMHAISNDDYKIDEELPSVNQLSKALHMSRDTVFKAYIELKKRGVVASRPTKGYYVNNPNFRVFLFLDSYSPYKDTLYNAIIKKLPQEYTVDLVFHHYNPEIFELAILNALGRYNMYVVMNHDNEQISGIIEKIDQDKLLILDWGKISNGDFSYIRQDFEQQPYDCLNEARDKFRKYNKLCYVNTPGCVHPVSFSEKCRKFAKKSGLQFEIVDDINNQTVRNGNAYILFRQKDLVSLIKITRNKTLEVGKNIGIVAYNDTPLYEIISNGITTISADFKKMGEKTADFILTKERVNEVIPTSIIFRNSL